MCTLAKDSPKSASNLDDADLVSNIQGIVVLGEANVGLLLAVGPDEGVDLLGVDVLDLLHGRLGGERVLKDGIPVQAVGAGAVLAGVLALAGLGESLGKVEPDVGPDLRGLSVDTLGDRLGDTLSLGFVIFCRHLS